MSDDEAFNIGKCDSHFDSVAHQFYCFLSQMISWSKTVAKKPQPSRAKPSYTKDRPLKTRSTRARKLRSAKTRKAAQTKMMRMKMAKRISTTRWTTMTS